MELVCLGVGFLAMLAALAVTPLVRLAAKRRLPVLCQKPLAPDLQQAIDSFLAQISHKGVEQKGGRGVRKLENTELYDDTLYRPEHDRL